MRNLVITVLFLTACGGGSTDELFSPQSAPGAAGEPQEMATGGKQPLSSISGRKSVVDQAGEGGVGGVVDDNGGEGGEVTGGGVAGTASVVAGSGGAGGHSSGGTGGGSGGSGGAVAGAGGKVSTAGQGGLGGAAGGGGASGSGGALVDPKTPWKVCQGGEVCGDDEVCVYNTDTTRICTKINDQFGHCNPYAAQPPEVIGQCDDQPVACRQPYRDCNWMSADADGTRCATLGHDNQNRRWNCGPPL